MLAAKQGHVVNIASMAGHSGTNKLVDYSASKFAAVGLDEAFRAEILVQVGGRGGSTGRQGGGVLGGRGGILGGREGE